jgi:hypothetical protein
LVLLGAQQAQAKEYEAGEDWTVRWDNTFKFNYGIRTEEQSDAIVLQGNNASVGILADDGDLGWEQWDTTTARLDILSEFDAVFKDGKFGVRVSAAGWYDYAYNDDTDFPVANPYLGGTNTWSLIESGPGQLNNAGESLHYLGGELLDAFVFTNFDMGSVPVNIRAGRHTIFWGNTLLFQGAVHGVASSAVPLDLNKAFTVPGSEAQELFLPTNKISTVLQFTPNLSLSAYYSLEWQETRLPAPGSYFSPAEILGDDPELIMLAPGAPGGGPRVGTMKVHDGEPDDSGDFGVNLQYYFGKLDLEAQFFYVNYSSNIPDGLVGTLDFGQTVAVFGAAGVPPFSSFYPAFATAPDVLAPDALGIGQWKWNYKEDIDLFGFSLSKQIGEISYALEYVRRENTPLRQELGNSIQLLANIPAALQPILGPGFDIDASGPGNYAGPVGSTNHIIVNAFGFLSAGALWDGGAYIVELVGSETDKVDSDPYGMLHEDIGVGDWSMGLSFKVIPDYYQVFAGVDMKLPISVAYTIDNEPAIGNGGNPKIGTATFGVEFNIRNKWTVSSTYTMIYGEEENGLLGLLVDRDNIAFTVKRTF